MRPNSGIGEPVGSAVAASNGCAMRAPSRTRRGIQTRRSPVNRRASGGPAGCRPATPRRARCGRLACCGSGTGTAGRPAGTGATRAENPRATRPTLSARELAPVRSHRRNHPVVEKIRSRTRPAARDDRVGDRLGSSPFIGMRLSLPSAKNASIRPSGDQKGVSLASVFMRARPSRASSGRIQKRLRFSTCVPNTNQLAVGREPRPFARDVGGPDREAHHLRHGLRSQPAAGKPTDNGQQRCDTEDDGRDAPAPQPDRRGRHVLGRTVDRHAGRPGRGDPAHRRSGSGSLAPARWRTRRMSDDRTPAGPRAGRAAREVVERRAGTVRGDRNSVSAIQC